MSTLLQTRDGTPSNKDARLTNVILEKNGQELDVLKRPGFTTYLAQATGTGQGAFVATNADGTTSVAAIISDTIYSTQTGISTSFTSPGSSDVTGLPLRGLVYFNGKYWIINPGNASVYSSPTGASWTLVTNTPAYDAAFGGAFRTRMGVLAFGGKMWILGGVRSDTGNALNDVWSSPDGVTWKRATSNAAWSVCAPMGVVVFKGKMWIVGRMSGATANTLTADVYYSANGITWTLATASPGWAGMFAPMVFTVGGKIFFAGGMDGSLVFNNNVWSSPDGITWTQEANASWTARAYAGCATLNGFVYVALGIVTAGPTYVKDMWRSPDGVTWTQMSANIGITGSGGAGVWGGFLSNAPFPIGGAMVATNSTITFIYQNDGSNVYTINTAVANTFTTTVAQLAVGGNYDFSQTLDHAYVAIKNTSGAWQYQVDGQILTQVTNVNYPASTVRGLAYLDGTFYVMDQYGQIWGSNVNDFLTWTALNVINAQSEPDLGVCLTKYGQYVVAFGQYTTEFFFDAGNSTGSPLSVVSNATQLVGCAAADCVVQAESSVFWIAQAKSHGQTFNPQRFVARLDGLTYVVMSTPNVDRILNADSLVGAWGLFCKMLGHSFYIISLPASGLSLAYDMRIGTWYVMTSGTTQAPQSIGAGKMTYTIQTDGKALVNVNINSHGFADGDPITIASATQTAYNGTWNIRYVDANNFTFVATSVPAATPATGSPTATGTTQGVFPLLQAFSFGGLQLFQNPNDGHLYQMSDTTYSDNTVFIDTKGRFERFDEGLSQDGNSQNKFNGWMDVVTDRASSTMLVRWSDDDYQTFIHYRPVDLSFARSRLARCGTFLRRAYEIRHTDKVAMRFQGLDLGLEQGTE